jgi:hypothetical protein
MDQALGESGVVETEGKVYMSEQGEKGRVIRAYFVRIEGIGPVSWLAKAGWNRNNPRSPQGLQVSSARYSPSWFILFGFFKKPCFSTNILLYQGWSR